MREASESRLPRAKEAKPLRLGNRSAGQSLPPFTFAPPATLLHRPLPLFLKAVCVYDGIMGVKNSYFSFMKTSATKFKAKRTNLVVATNTYFCLVSKPLTGVTGLKSQTFFLPTNTASSPLLAVADSFFWGASIG